MTQYIVYPAEVMSAVTTAGIIKNFLSKIRFADTAIVNIIEVHKIKPTMVLGKYCEYIHTIPDIMFDISSNKGVNPYKRDNCIHIFILYKQQNL